MSGHNDEVTRLLAAIAEEEPPGALRERALAGARTAWERPADRWVALWESRPLRVAWSAAVVLLVAANVGVRATVHGGAPGGPTRASQGGMDQRNELQAVTGLPRLRPDYADTFRLRPVTAAPAPQGTRSEDKP